MKPQTKTPFGKSRDSMKTTKPIFQTLLGAIILALALAALPSRAQNAPPQLMSYQGYLTDQSGNPLGSTNTGPKNYTVYFRIWSQSVGGVELYAEQQTVTVNNGYLSVLLGLGAAVGSEPYNNGNIAGIFGPSGTTTAFVELTVVGIGPSNGNVTILPRLQLVTSPYSFMSSYAATAGSLVNSGNGGVLTIAGKTVYITNSSGSGLNLNGNLYATNGIIGTVYAGTENISGTATIAALNATTANITTATMNTVTLGGPLTILGGSSTTNGGFVPKGGIILWSGAANAIPAGWALCNGQNGTPNLENNFVIGAGNNYAVGATGGASSVTLSAGNIPDHRHQYKDTVFAEHGIVQSHSIGPDKIGSGTDSADNGDNNSGYGFAGSTQGYDMDNDLSWIWRLTYYGYSGNSTPQTPGPVNIMPPYYALAYIMRIQ